MTRHEPPHITMLGFRVAPSQPTNDLPGSISLSAVGWDEAKRNPGYPHAMRTYLRDRTPGGCYFFTVNLADRKRHTLIQHIDALRDAFRTTLANHPARVDAIVVLPDHLHCLWQLPSDDADYPLRWRLIKARFAVRVTDDMAPSASRRRRGERAVWQRRYWEHRIRDDDDYAKHLDYIHYNPVKHGHVGAARDWPYSSFRRWVTRGIYTEDWGSAPAHRPPP